MRPLITLLGLAIGLTAVTSANAAIIDNTLPANNQANLSAQAGQTFTINITGTLNTVGSPRFGQKLSTIEIEGPQTTVGGDPLGPFTLEVWTDADGITGTWGTGTLVATSTNSASLVAGGATKTTFNFSNQKLTPGKVYAFTYTNGSGTRIAARPGLTNATAITDGSVFSAGATPFSNAFDTAMRITANEAIILDHVNLPSLVTAGSQSSFTYQSFTPSVAGLGTTDTVAANSPLTPVVAMETVSFVRAPSGTATAGSLFIDVYTGGAGAAGTFVGSSLDSIDINSATSLTVMTWNFDNLYLNSSSEYSLVFSTTSGAGGPATGRIAGANNGGGFVNTYTGGSTTAAYDALFAVTFVAVPETSTIVTLGIGLLGLVLFGWHRRRNK